MLGLVLIVASAAFFALATVRLGRYTNTFDCLKLSTFIAAAVGAISVLWVWWEGQLGRQAAVLSSLMSDPTSFGLLMWLGLGPGALAAYLQAAGQRTVPATQAQVGADGCALALATQCVSLIGGGAGEPAWLHPQWSRVCGKGATWVAPMVCAAACFLLQYPGNGACSARAGHLLHVTPVVGGLCAAGACAGRHRRLLGPGLGACVHQCT